VRKVHDNMESGMRKLILATASAIALGIVGAGPLYAQNQNTDTGSAGTMPQAAPRTPATGITQPSMPQDQTGTPAPSGANEASSANTTGMNADWARLSRSDVQQIQEKLRSDGLYHGQIDGLMGPGTQQALRTYQRKNGLPVTGTPDPQTLSSLQIATTGAGSSTAPNALEMSPSSGAGTSGTGNTSMPNGVQH
jgi:peptidoglycan hydrolase-like protein with peptidoglycan-binding domain